MCIRDRRNVGKTHTTAKRGSTRHSSVGTFSSECKGRRGSARNKRLSCSIAFRGVSCDGTWLRRVSGSARRAPNQTNRLGIENPNVTTTVATTFDSTVTVTMTVAATRNTRHPSKRQSQRHSKPTHCSASRNERRKSENINTNTIRSHIACSCVLRDFRNDIRYR